MTDASKSQIETDNDPEHFKERLAKVVKHKPVRESPVNDLEDDDELWFTIP